MARTRKITVDSPDGKYVDIQTDATTWGELKSEIEDNGIAVSGMKGVTQGTKLTLENDGAELPAGDFTVYLFTAKVKSGLDTAEMMKDLKEKMMTAYDEVIDNIEDGTYGEEETPTSDAKKALKKGRAELEEGM